MTTRCKFRCQSQTKRAHWDREKGFVWDYEFSAVASDANPENQAFFEATPAGTLKVSTVKIDSFEVGRDYFLDLSLAPEASSP